MPKKEILISDSVEVDKVIATCNLLPFYSLRSLGSKS